MARSLHIYDLRGLVMHYHVDLICSTLRLCYFHLITFTSKNVCNKKENCLRRVVLFDTSIDFKRN